MNKLTKRIFYGLIFVAGIASFANCSKTQSYSELLREEEEATNWYMAQQRIEVEVPADSIFEYGENAPYYKMDEEGYIYMQVLNPGTKDNMAKENEQIYFRYMRTNLKEMYQGLDPDPIGNADNMNHIPTSFRFKNLELSSSSTYGAGIQLPLYFLGVDCEVNLVIRSYYGFSGESGQCLPFVYNIRYFRGQSQGI